MNTGSLYMYVSGSFSLLFSNLTNVSMHVLANTYVSIFSSFRAIVSGNTSINLCQLNEHIIFHYGLIWTTKIIKHFFCLLIGHYFLPSEVSAHDSLLLKVIFFHFPYCIMFLLGCNLLFFFSFCLFETVSPYSPKSWWSSCLWLPNDVVLSVNH